MSFRLVATDGPARAGVLTTAHGDVPTPAFMPVGTKATVKGIDPDVLRSLGAAILLGNTYHLFFRPGDETIEALGGLHRFMAWDGPILTDSGGFQVFSLRHTVLAADDDGVSFRSVYDGREARFTPELAAAIQRRLGSDIAMALDICLPAGAARRRPRDGARANDRLGTRGSSTSLARTVSCCSASRREGSHPELRRRSIEEITALGFDGYALGGLSVGEDRELMLDTVAWSAPLLPAERPRYFMGIGDPEGVLEMIARGIDMFDCVLPTRVGRTGSALTWDGRLNLRNTAFTRDERPLQEGCACHACTRFSRAYVRHLVNQRELLGLILLSVHNVRFVLDVTAGARAAIERGEFGAYRDAALSRLAGAAPSHRSA